MNIEESEHRQYTGEYISQDPDGDRRHEKIKKPRNILKIVLLILLGVVILVLIGLGLWYSLSNKGDKPLEFDFNFKKIINLSGINRTYYVQVPTGFNTSSNNYPAIIAIHGMGSIPADMALTKGFGTLGPSRGYVSVFPQSDQKDLTWNAGGACCFDAMKNNISDITFISDMIDDIISNYKVNMNQIFVTGYSNGAFLTYDIVCSLSDYIAGAATFVGNLLMKNTTEITEDCGETEKDDVDWNTTATGCGYQDWTQLSNIFSCNLTQEVPMLIMNGKLDGNVNYEGWWSDQERWPPVYFGPRYFIEKYNCSYSDLVETFMNVSESNSEDFTQCNSTNVDLIGSCNTNVTFCVANTSGHSWWTFNENEKIGVDGVEITKTFNVTTQILDFFDSLQ